MVTSERRTIFNEPDELINKKVKKALESGLNPIFCIGETLEERESGTTKDVVEKQIRGGLKDVTEAELANIIVAYEPVWAIGTGKTSHARAGSGSPRFYTFSYYRTLQRGSSR